MASYFDLSSPKDGAVFWSGNKTEAMNYANKINGTTMEGTRGGQVFDDWNWLGNQFPEWDSKNILDQQPIWRALSEEYANGASGMVYYVHPEDYTGKIWSKVELPIIEKKIKTGNVIDWEEVFVNGKK